MGIREKYQITEYCHHFLRDYIREGDICVDATAGNGGDTEFLCRLAGENGKVYAFDVQEQAVRSTEKRLERAGLRDRAELICAGHERMKEFVKERAAAVVFNLGYLPGGDHAVATKADTTLRAAEQALELLKPGGVVSLCIYSGGDTGYEERDTLLSWLRELDPRRWLVIVNCYYNRRNDPPLPVFIIRLEP
ncbi:MAG: class I SAM-dependent methyltransferase [Mediterraneibacter sp.]